MGRARAKSTAGGGRGVGRVALGTKWEALAAEAFLGVKEWRLQHPKATFAEIEAAVDERLSAVRARMLEDVALASAAAAVSDAPLVARPACPVCVGSAARGPSTGRLEVRGRPARVRVTVTYGRTVTLTRDYAVCSVRWGCAPGHGAFPPWMRNWRCGREPTVPPLWRVPSDWGRGSLSSASRSCCAGSRGCGSRRRPSSA